MSRKAILILAALVALIVALRFVSLPGCAAAQAYAAEHEVLAPLAYFGLYVLATVAFVPGILITVVAGSIWGPVWGTALASLSSIVGATAAFSIARTVGRVTVERYLGERPWYKTFKEGLKGDALRFVLVVRLAPLFPFNASNYACGLLPIGYRDYLIGSALGMLPATFAYVYFGDTGCAALEQGAMSPEVRTKLLIVSIVVIGVSLAPAIVKRRRRRA